MRIVIKTIVLCLLMAKGYSQAFNAQCVLPQVEKDGFYKIALSPRIAPYVNSTFSNIRVLNSNGTQAPFVLREEKEATTRTHFIPYLLEDKVLLKDSCTVMVLKNDLKTMINNITLVIRNAAIQKEAFLYGSDDKVTWYALKDRFKLGSIENEHGTSEVKIVDFPKSDYTYYKIWIDDKLGAPVNVVQAGYYEAVKGSSAYEEVPIAKLSQEEDLEKDKTVIRMGLDTFRTVDKVSWKIVGIPFYHRSASLYTLRKTTDKRGTPSQYRDYISAFDINARQENTQYLPALKLDNLFLEVSNGDNQALKFEEIKLYQNTRYLITWLRKNEKYSLTFGDENMMAPDYDLRFFDDAIPSDLKGLEPGDVQHVTAGLLANDSALFTTNRMVWIAIVLVVITLGVMSVKIVRETKRTEESVKE